MKAYRRFHSTETALLRVMSDILKAADQQQVTLLGLLDLSAAFDCVDREILLARLQRGMGLDGVVLSWPRSFLTDRHRRIADEYCGGAAVTKFPTKYFRIYAERVCCASNRYSTRSLVYTSKQISINIIAYKCVSTLKP